MEFLMNNLLTHVNWEQHPINDANQSQRTHTKGLSTEQSRKSNYQSPAEVINRESIPTLSAVQPSASNQQNQRRGGKPALKNGQHKRALHMAQNQINQLSKALLKILDMQRHVNFQIEQFYKDDDNFFDDQQMQAAENVDQLPQNIAVLQNLVEAEGSSTLNVPHGFTHEHSIPSSPQMHLRSGRTLSTPNSPEQPTPVAPHSSPQPQVAAIQPADPDVSMGGPPVDPRLSQVERALLDTEGRNMQLSQELNRVQQERLALEQHNAALQRSAQEQLEASRQVGAEEAMMQLKHAAEATIVEKEKMFLAESEARQHELDLAKAQAEAYKQQAQEGAEAKERERLLMLQAEQLRLEKEKLAADMEETVATMKSVTMGNYNLKLAAVQEQEAELRRATEAEKAALLKELESKEEFAIQKQREKELQAQEMVQQKQALELEMLQMRQQMQAIELEKRSAEQRAEQERWEKERNAQMAQEANAAIQNQFQQFQMQVRAEMEMKSKEQSQAGRTATWAKQSVKSKSSVKTVQIEEMKGEMFQMRNHLEESLNQQTEKLHALDTKAEQREQRVIDQMSQMFQVLQQQNEKKAESVRTTPIPQFPQPNIDISLQQPIPAPLYPGPPGFPPQPQHAPMQYPASYCADVAMQPVPRPTPPQGYPVPMTPAQSTYMHQSNVGEGRKSFGRAPSVCGNSDTFSAKKGVSDKNIKASLPTFSGGPGVESFIGVFESLCSRGSLDEDTRYTFLIGSLKGPAYQWLQDQPGWLHWTSQQVLAALKEEYGKMQDTAVARLEQLQYKDDMVKFNTEFQQIGTGCKQLCSEYMQKRIYMKAIRPYGLQQQLRGHANQLTLHQLMATAVELEPFHKPRYNNNQNSFNGGGGRPGYNNHMSNGKRARCQKCFNWHWEDQKCPKCNPRNGRPNERPDNRGRSPKVNEGQMGPIPEDMPCPQHSPTVQESDYNGEAGQPTEPTTSDF